MKTLAEVRAGLDSGAKEICSCGDIANCHACFSRKLVMLSFDQGANAVMEQAQKLVAKLEKIALEDDDNKDFARDEDEAQYYIDTAKDALKEWQEFVEGKK